MRAMALLYLGTSPLPIDLASDYYLSPVMAPDDLLARFPKTFLLCGEKDPFVDDTVVFAGRLRENKQKARKEWERMMRKVETAGGIEALLDKKQKQKLQQQREANGSPSNGTANGNGSTSFNDHMRTHIFSRDPNQMVRVKILEGVSHAIFQMTSLIPEAKQAARLTADWFNEILQDPGVDDHGDDLTEFMIRDIHQRHRTDVGNVGPYYPAHGVPQHPPAPHILVNGASSVHGSTESLLSNGVGASVRFEDMEESSSISDTSSEEGSIPILDEVDEKEVLKRRRTQLGSLLYGDGEV